MSRHAPAGNSTIRQVNESMTPKPLKPSSKKQAPVKRPDDQSFPPSSATSHPNDNKTHPQQPISRKQMASSSAEPLYTSSLMESSPSKTRDGKPYGGSDFLPVQRATQSPESQQVSSASPQNMPRTMRPKGESRGNVRAMSAAKAQDVVDRARSNNVETHVIESVAPGKTIETPPIF